ncbi:DNA cytosine methyltransferase [Methylophilus sp.]|uniref:DNA cytosine methyltransferase n=1 Tax=Methylophilus sp. TaxID=29541 RepID=UPI000D48FC01|nr:DNA cytosine methyltransferase [Methylophilus sp.]PPD12154.1 MAG: DNA cytosine methyltransferase [Methylophilus sp.]
MRELALFAGAGGGILGGHLLGWRTICAVERDAYAAQVLAQRQNDGILRPFPIWSDVCSFDGRPWRGLVDVVSGGFPCQDISAAGKGAGITGARSGMWKEMARIIGEVRPRFVFVENSPMLTTRGLGVVLGDLAALGFDAEWGVLSAADVGANHQRERIWIVGYSHDNGQITAEISRGAAQGSNICATRQEQTSKFARPSEQHAELADTKCNGRETWRGYDSKHDRSIIDSSCEYTREVANADRQRQQGIIPCQSHPEKRKEQGERPVRPFSDGVEWWSVEPDVGRVANGVDFRVDRLKGLGNGQVPAVAATAFELLRARFEQ